MIMVTRRRSVWFSVLALLLSLADEEVTVRAFAAGAGGKNKGGRGNNNNKSSTTSGMGFGKPSGGPPPAKTYGKESQSPIKDMIDVEAAMESFFSAREDWLPLFRSLSPDAASCKASSFLEDVMHLEDADFHETSSPWQRLQAIPEYSDDDKAHLSTFLDSMHQSLLDIPVTNSVGTAEDDNDMQFLEEGRRMLAVNRFHVVRESSSSSSSNDRATRYETLFRTVWNEVMELRTVGEEHTGSLILFPDSDLSDVRRFADMNLIRPLEWLGVRHDFEVASMQRGSPAIRLIYRLQAIPDIPDDPSAFADGEDSLLGDGGGDF